MFFNNLQSENFFMRAIKIETEGDEFVIRVKKNSFNETFVTELLRKLRMELLAKEVDFDPAIDTVGEEIKADWWQKNGERLLNKQ